MNSMTGFGRASAPIESFMARVEISGVNRKQLEVAFGIPRGCTEWEQPIRTLIQNAVSRGRVFVSISFDPQADTDGGQISLNEKKLDCFLRQLDQASAISGRKFQPSATDLIRLDIIHSASSSDIENTESWPQLEPLVREALSHFLDMRSTEGEHLRRDLLEKLDTLRRIKKEIEQLAPDVPVRLRENMVLRLQEAGLPVDLDDERLVKEITLFSDKCDISEELSRLNSHFAQFEALCAAETPSGRPLDFLCQEIYREYNTIGSKANDARLAHLVVSGKTELEKIREQVQNIE